MPTAMRRRAPAPRTGAVSTQNQFQRPTAQAKIIETTTKFGARGIKKNQGSTIIKYDVLPLTEGLNPVTVYTFFQDAQTRQFPFTNLTDGKLQVGEAMAIQRIYFAILVQLAATGEFTDVQTFEEFAAEGFYVSTFNFMISNSQVVKPTPVSSFKGEFNRASTFNDYNVFHFDTDIVIPTLLEFACNLKAPILTVPTSATLNFYIGCYIEGTGSILAPRSTF